MKCPVTCDRCGELLELDESNFNVSGWCACTLGCNHGICDDCKEVVYEESD